MITSKNFRTLFEEKNMVSELSTQTWMLLFFGLFLAISLWKISAFFTNKRVADDDTTESSRALLEEIMLQTIAKNGADLTPKTLYEAMKRHESFDAKQMWRFNENRVRHLLEFYYAKHPKTSSIAEIYKDIK